MGADAQVYYNYTVYHIEKSLVSANKHTVTGNKMGELRAVQTSPYRRRLKADRALVDAIANYSDEVSSPSFSNIIYCIACTICNQLYIGEPGRKLGDHFRQQTPVY